MIALIDDRDRIVRLEKLHGFAKSERSGDTGRPAERMRGKDHLFLYKLSPVPVSNGVGRPGQEERIIRIAGKGLLVASNTEIFRMFVEGTATGIRRLSETGELVPVISVPEPVVRAENIRDGAATLLIAGSGALFVS